ncbi:hypothetical protein NN561_010260 [Cricetulus griseus]
MAKGHPVNLYTDSRYTFITAHVHGESYRRRGLLTSAGKDIKNKTEIRDLLRALFLPQKLSIIHCPGHQKGDDPVAKGNRMADEEARKAALGPQILSLKTPVPENGDLDDDAEAILAVDFEIGHCLRERIIPRSVLYFTGEAIEDADDDYDEEGEETDEEGEEEGDEENDPDYDPKKDQNPAECKQQ